MEGKAGVCLSRERKKFSGVLFYLNGSQVGVGGDKKEACFFRAGARQESGAEDKGELPAVAVPPLIFYSRIIPSEKKDW